MGLCPFKVVLCSRNLSAYENLHCLTQYLGWSTEKEEERIRIALRLTGNCDRCLAHAAPSKLSGGQPQRIKA